ncbi:MAG: MarR family transcriptional regulator [Betaproteobacteria bacterium]|jgi:DNA-binding MarR family transcriptional regulator|nr:MarR family transcriptional regulator [Betaproteobacteria bacterium]NBS48125.1 MarR family transcriptional regulator [Betaproteobacteria bacterium]
MSKVRVGSPPDAVDTTYLETLLGYNARRAALTAIARFLENMAPFDLRPVEFSVLSVIRHNPGVTSRQLCAALGLQPPNLVGLVRHLESRALLRRKPHPQDGRAVGLHLSAAGERLMQQAERTVSDTEDAIVAHLSEDERQTLVRLLQKVYRG